MSAKAHPGDARLASLIESARIVTPLPLRLARDGPLPGLASVPLAPPPREAPVRPEALAAPVAPLVSAVVAAKVPEAAPPPQQLAATDKSPTTDAFAAAFGLGVSETVQAAEPMPAAAPEVTDAPPELAASAPATSEAEVATPEPAPEPPPAASEPVATRLAMLAPAAHADPSARFAGVPPAADVAEPVAHPAEAPASSLAALASTIQPREPVLGLTAPLPSGSLQPAAGHVRQAVPTGANDNGPAKLASLLPVTGTAPPPAASFVGAVPPAATGLNSTSLASSVQGPVGAGRATAGLAPIVPQLAALAAGAERLPGFTENDEIIFEFTTSRREINETIIGYGRRGIIYLPLGEIARLLDLAINVSDEGRYAAGWALDPAKTITINLREGSLTLGQSASQLAAADAVAFEGELYLRAEKFGDILPLTLVPNLRAQSVMAITRTPFPFEERMARETARERLAGQQSSRVPRNLPQETAPWLALAMPIIDVEARALSDTRRGPRAEGDLRVAGDFAWLSARAFASLDSQQGITAAAIELGRRDPEAQLLGPLKATAFGIGDVTSTPLALGLSSTTGRGLYVGNAPVQRVSVFDKVDLRGAMPDGYEVELYRNDFLIDSTRSPVNGEYQFLNVPVEFGLNVFRIVLYGPQGQRRETIRQVNVGDGQLAKGQLQYAFGAVQKSRSVFDFHPDDYIAAPDDGSWRLSGQMQYGLSSKLTAQVGGAWYERFGQQHWLGTAGLRTGLAGAAVKFDVGLADGGAKAFEIGVARKIAGFSVTANHAEYRGGFVDEVRSYSDLGLRRASDVSINGTIRIGSSDNGLRIPVYALARDITFADGRRVQTASLNQSLPLARNMQLSNLLEYNRTATPGFAATNQLYGAFNLATLYGSSTQFRASVGYSIAPRSRLTNVLLAADRRLGETGSVKLFAGRDLVARQNQLGLSASRRFKHFSLAVEGNYTTNPGQYSAMLRLGFSLGRNPLSGGMFLAPPGMASGGAVALRAFRDADADGRFGPGDEPLAGVEFHGSTETVTTDASGMALIGRLGDGPKVAVQLESETLPDVSLASLVQAFETVPRAGRILAKDVPIVALGELSGSAMYRTPEGDKPVSGLRILLTDASGTIAARGRTARDGSFWLEKLRQGSYDVTVDPEQAARLNIRLAEPVKLQVGGDGATLELQLVVVPTR